MTQEWHNGDALHEWRKSDARVFDRIYIVQYLLNNLGPGTMYHQILTNQISINGRKVTV